MKPTLKIIHSATGFKAIELSEFLQADILGWPIEILFDKAIESLPNGGDLLVDVVVFPKENTSKMDAKIAYSSCQKRALQGQEYAVLTWTKDTLTQVVGFRKIEANNFQVTQDMLVNFLSFGISVTEVRADGAYFKSNFRRGLRQIQMDLISKPRRDSWWFLGCEEIQLKHWIKELKVDSFHHYGKQGVYARSFIMARHDCAPSRVVVIRPKRSCEMKKVTFLLSTDVNLTTREIIVGYRKRWRIEVLFRDCSQNLGLKSHQGYSQTSERHVAMVFLTYNILAKLKSESGKTIGRLIREFQKLCEPIRTRDSVRSFILS